jgi:small subunit ribosomal protein S1
MQALLEQGGYDMPQRGDIREGTIISVSPQEIVIDLGLKREAIVPASDLSRLEKSALAEIVEGTTWPVYILQPSDREGNLIVSLSRALQEKDWLVAQETMDSNEMFEALVTGHNSGGLEVEFGKLRGFVPASHISTLPRDLSEEERKAQLAAYVGKMVPLKIVEVDRKKRRLIMSERAAHRRWQREHRKQLLDEIEIGEVRTGIVRSLANFGAFVDLGGADGLIHISELAWFPVAHPSEVLKLGQPVEVKVLRIDKPRERVGLSLKRVQPDPWSSVEQLYSAGELVEAVVTRVSDFGAFVRLRSGVEGLLHVSEMADIRPDHPQSLVSPGDLLLLRVLRIEPERRRIGLSLRQVSETEWAEWAASYRERHAVTAQVEGGELAEGEQRASSEEFTVIASGDADDQGAVSLAVATDEVGEVIGMAVGEMDADGDTEVTVLTSEEGAAVADELVSAAFEAVEEAADAMLALPASDEALAAEVVAESSPAVEDTVDIEPAVEDSVDLEPVVEDSVNLEPVVEAVDLAAEDNDGAEVSAEAAEVETVEEGEASGADSDADAGEDEDDNTAEAGA